MSDILYIGLKITLTEIKLKVMNNMKRPPYLAAFRITKFDNHLQK